MLDIWGGFISLTSILDISTALMRPRGPKQYCLQLVIYIYILSSATTALSTLRQGWLDLHIYVQLFFEIEVNSTWQNIYWAVKRQGKYSATIHRDWKE